MTECRPPDSKNDAQKGLPAGRMLTKILLGSTLLFGVGVLVIWMWLEGDWTDKAPIGDALNILTSLFSALAFAAVALSLWYQHREVSSTLQELKDANRASEANLAHQSRIADAMMLQAEASYRPYMVFRLSLEEGSIMYLTVENTGRTAALDLHLSTTAPDSYPGAVRDHGDLKKTSLFKNGSGTFAPGQFVRYLIAQGSEISEEDPEFRKHPPTFKISASYKWYGREETVNEMHIIDMRSFHNSFIYQAHEMREIVRIRKALEKMAPL